MPDKADTGPQMDFVDRYIRPGFGRRKRTKDVELKNDTGRVDSRLKKKNLASRLRSPGTILREAFAGKKKEK